MLSADGRLIKLEFDTPLANGVGQILQRVKGGGVTSEEKASIEVLLESIRSSKMWPRLIDILEDQKVVKKCFLRVVCVCVKAWLSIGCRITRYIPALPWY